MSARDLALEKLLAASPPEGEAPAPRDPAGRDPDPERRSFLKAGLAAATVAGLGLWGFGATPPTGEETQEAAPPPPSYAVLGDGPRLAICKSADRASCLAKGLEALGGMGRFIQPGDHVVLKVNAAFAAPPILGATTHPETLAAMIGLCHQAGATKVVVTDNPINDPAACFQLTGLAQAARDNGAELALPAPEAFRPVTLPQGRLIVNWPFLAGPLEGATKVIGLAQVKDHHRSGASLAMKNWYGLLGGRRNVFHQDIHGIIAELARLITPTLVVLDGIQVMMHNGPTGGSPADLARGETMILGVDQVAADTAAATLLLRRDPASLPFLAQAAAAGAGTTDWRSLNPLEVAA